MLPFMLDPNVLAPERIRPLMRREYEAMVEHGLLGPDDHVELLRGTLVEMSPQGVAHAAICAWLVRELVLALGRGYDVRCQAPYAATDDSEPEPDVFVSRISNLAEHPSTALLVIEVAATSLQKDRVIKTGIYAENGVAEYWIVNIEEQQVEVLTMPSRDGYRHREVRASGLLRPVMLPAVKIAVAEIPWSGAMR
jgi:Uma2 family endonuclease